MPATLPSNFTPIHAPTAAEMAQIINAITGITNIGVWTSFGGCALTLASTTAITDINGASTSYTKQLASTKSDLLVIAFIGWRVQTAVTAARFYVSINAISTQLALQELDTASAHSQTIGWARITGLGAGGYTPKLQAQKVVNNANQVVIDGNDALGMIIAELPL